MHTLSRFLLISIVTLALPATGLAQSLDELRNLTPEDRRSYFQSMSDEERSAMRDKWRDEYENLPEEEKQAIREERRQARRERRESMSDQERAAAREKWHKRKASRHRSHRNCHGANSEPESD